MHNGIARGVGPIAKTMADIIDTAANMALAKIIAGRVEIPLRTGAIGIAGGERQRQRQEAQAEQSHINGSFRPSSCPSGGKFQYSGVISNSRQQLIGFYPWRLARGIDGDHQLIQL
jgi:hypothetical protein